MSDGSKSPKEESNQSRSANEPIEDPNSGKQESKKSMSPLIIVGAVLEFIVLVLIVVATPLDVFRVTKEIEASIGLKLCYSMWGIKQCGPHKVFRNKPLPHHGFICKEVDRLMTCAAAFAIISIFFVLLTFIFALVAGCGSMSGIVPGIFAILSAAFLCICFACQAGTRNKHCNTDMDGLVVVYAAVKDYAKYGAAFGLSVAAFGLQVIAALLILIGCCVGGSKKSDDKKSSSSSSSSEAAKDDADANE
ncbi:amastin-like surface protein [Angomonas deanei]|uniref:Amastin surface glycoprotein, putative n=1 Tax=Angomonas deanei TaxID=59799 RepID=A0A7G2CUL0_9TRYP|nr:amastin-like surface protein [Angomonas deanei]CAD2221952.1 Amastin surface glycoprotein, putative [Angomonas deanei]|eukprot:EPY21359.1 amastin-like surface protein [Angomonas deanei]